MNVCMRKEPCHLGEALQLGGDRLLCGEVLCLWSWVGGVRACHRAGPRGLRLVLGVYGGE